MKKLYPCLFGGYLLLLASFAATAQDSTHFRRDSLRNRRDTATQSPDTTRFRRGGGMTSIFTDSAALTSSDYQLQIEKAYVILNNIENKSDLGNAVKDIKDKLADDDSMLAVLKDNILNNAGALNLRNLQVFETLLQNIKSDLKERRVFLDSTDNMLSDLKNSMATLIADTVLKQLQRDSVLRELNNGRPIIIASHSQGSKFAERLLKEYFENKALAGQLVVAYILGWSVPKEYFGSLKMCSDSLQTGCICSWRTLRNGYVPYYLKSEKGNSFVTNPLTWTTDEQYASRKLNKGSVLTKFNKMYKHTTDARISNGFLYVKKPKFPWSFYTWAKIIM
ncbi:MAG: DUF3089 domain-containing protein [Bacteroidota bacterium]